MIPDLAVDCCRTNTNFDRSPLIDHGKGSRHTEALLEWQSPVMLQYSLRINIRIKIDIWSCYGMCRALPGQFNIHRMVLF